ncbi:MAG: NnrS family protein [Betaproteobacteria bacterium HGW-Betaproteobacteria-1]|jgi:uncharacterized protein involved in response to NO|nr:MAG: NnrS family protein [Betaproteobacteria bacterium HGW-Betaproteobacteria-1]
MLVQPVEISRNKTDGFALFNLGFRPFFLGAGIFALISMTVWIASYALAMPLAIEAINPMQWHAHEMLYGYGLTVIAGFLLTAVKNWTGVQTVHGKALLGLFAVWVLARLLMLAGTGFIAIAAVLDLLFGLLLMVAVAHPIIKVRQWQQLAVLSKLVIIVAGNGLFYLGALGYVENVVHLSLYGALYLIISLIMLIGRRVIPFFIERGVEKKIKLRQHRWLDISILLFFILFFINELFIGRAEFTPLTTGLLFLLNGLRLFNWHTPGIWRAPLLWGLYVSSWLINAGFLLMALQYWLPISGILTVHLFTIGGIGLMTLSMMSRVALGHSGRNIRQPPVLVGYALALLVLSAVFRIGLPLIDMSHYLWWIIASYLCWMAAFALFVLVYAPILTKPRPDGQPG